MLTFDSDTKSSIKANWEQNGPINDALVNIVEPLAIEFSHEFAADLEIKTNAERQELLGNSCNVYSLTYDAMGILPPALFGDITEEKIMLTKELKIPEDDNQIAKMADDYETWANGKVAMQKYHYSVFPSSAFLIDQICKMKGADYPVQAWQSSAQLMQKALIDDTVFAMDAHRTARMENGMRRDSPKIADRLDEHAQHDSYALAFSKIFPPEGNFSMVRDGAQLPIGEYGFAAASKLAKTTIFINDYIKDSWAIDDGIRSRLNAKDVGLVRQYTARASELNNKGISDFAAGGVKNTLSEGVVSISQTIALLTANKLPGYDNHDELVREILDSDLIEQFTRSIRPGYIGPTTLSGLYVPHALELKNGKLALSESLLSVITGMRRKFIADTAAKWALFNESNGTTAKPDMLGLVCPAAKPNGAITTCKNVFKAMYKD